MNEEALQRQVEHLQNRVDELGATIAELREKEHALRTDCDRLGLALDASSDGVFDWNFETDEAFYSDRYVTMLGFELGEIPNRAAIWRELTHPDDAQSAQSIVEEYFQGKRDSHKLRYRMKTKSGDWIWVSSRGRVVSWDGDGKPLRMVGTHRDITELVAADDKLQATERRLRSLIEQTSDAVFCYEFNAPVATDLSVDEQVRQMYDCKLVECNLVCAQSYGATNVEKVIGRSLHDLFGAAAGSLDVLFRSVVESGYRIVDGEGSQQQPDGTMRFFLNNAYGIVADGKLLRMWGTFRDITEQKIARQELHKAQRLESLGILAGGIAHDFNNILGGLFGYMHVAKESVAPDSEAAEALTEALAVHGRAKALSRQLITFAKGGAVAKTPLSVAKVLEESSRFAMSGAACRCDLQVDGDLGPVLADEGQLGQVFNNVLINARQAMDGGGTITIRARNCNLDQGAMPPLPAGHYVQIDLADEGCGIPEEDRPKIFDPFFTTKASGSGLGLATSFSILAQHNGYITVEPGDNKGSVFTIFLPVTEGQEEPRRSSQTIVRKGVGCVLVMDDEPAVLNSTARMLRAFGYDVLETRNGEEALRVYAGALKENHKICAVILDLTVRGGMGGEHAVLKLKALNPEVPVIAATGYSDSPVVARCEDYGFSAVLKKPYSIEELSEVLSS